MEGILSCTMLPISSNSLKACIVLKEGFLYSKEEGTMSQCGFSVMEYGYASLKVADRRISRVVCDGISSSRHYPMLWQFPHR